MIWGNLLHLSFNMWADREVKTWGNLKPKDVRQVVSHPYLRFDEALWHDLTSQMAAAGLNMVVIDLGDGVRYDSHPEIAVKGAWKPAKLRQELVRLRKLGLEPIPKLNFSTSHDAWLGPYSRCVSTPVYYTVCADLIAETVQLFDRPRFFHLGYDEESIGNQNLFSYAVVRQHELWWDDFLFFVRQVERHGARPWIWSDYAWSHPAEFYKRMPLSVLQSNWWYWPDMNTRRLSAVRTFTDLEKHRHDQVPTASNWVEPENFKTIVEHCRRRIAPARLKGFLQTVWFPTLKDYRRRHEEAIRLVGEVIQHTRLG